MLVSSLNRLSDVTVNIYRSLKPLRTNAFLTAIAAYEIRGKKEDRSHNI
jgi:hypothetical protein